MNIRLIFVVYVFFLLLSLCVSYGGDDLAKRLLQLNPRNRISTTDAMRHHYFSDLPTKIHDLPDSKFLSVSCQNDYGPVVRLQDLQSQGCGFEPYQAHH